MRTLLVIPARWGATRLPGKPMRLVAGTPVIEHTWRRACEAELGPVIVATDDERIAGHIRAQGGTVVLTGDARSGTARVAEATALFGGAHHVLNVQGDQPFVPPTHIRAVATALHAHPIATARCAAGPSDAADPARVKVVCDRTGRALYFSRAPIPHGGPHWVHIGIYGFHADVLEACVAAPRGLESAGEDLEQLAWLEAGHPIHVVKVEGASCSVDTESQLDALRENA
jgi:3-deoxy-manno-octulosonate cytidylyltransferase (CMP-KDO synthetase)